MAAIYSLQYPYPHYRRRWISLTTGNRFLASALLLESRSKSKIKVGFDRQRAKDGQWLFTNNKIKAQSQQHVMDSLFGFSEFLGIKEHKYTWDIPIPGEAQKSAHTLIGNSSNYVIISPCSSKDYRNWHSPGYASIADYISEKYHCEVILTGGNSDIEKIYGDEIISASKNPPLNLISQTNWPCRQVNNDQW